MALIKCPECGQQVSDKAKSCIHCGFPIEEHVEKIEENKTTCQNCGSNNINPRGWCNCCGEKIVTQQNYVSIDQKVENNNSFESYYYIGKDNYNQNENSTLEDKWYSTDNFVAFMLFICTPMGLILMHVFKKFSVPVRVGLTVMIVLLYSFMIFSEIYLQTH